MHEARAAARRRPGDADRAVAGGRPIVLGVGRVDDGVRAQPLEERVHGGGVADVERRLAAAVRPDGVSGAAHQLAAEVAAARR